MTRQRGGRDSNAAVMAFSSRTISRARRHHLPLMFICAIAGFAVYRLLPTGGALFRMSMATAYVALGLLVATLAIGALEHG